MCRALRLVKDGSEFSLEPVKIERKKLYGWSELRVSAPDGSVCSQAGLDGNGVTVIPKGATKTGMLREDGCWMERSELQAVDASGNPVQLLPSSFEGAIALENRASEEEFLDHVITSVYQLGGEGSSALAALIGTDIYRFPFSYRGGYEQDDAFLLASNGTPFVFVGDGADFEFLGIGEEAVLDDPDEETSLEEDDLDFSMI